MPVRIDDDLERAAAAIAPYCALYIGGMGSKEQNFYNRLAHRMGFGDAAERIRKACAATTDLTASTPDIGDAVADRL